LSISEGQKKIRGISEVASTSLLKQYDVIIMASTFTFAYSITAGFVNGTRVSINRIFNSYQYSHVDASYIEKANHKSRAS